MYSGSVVGTTFEPAKSNIPLVLDYLRTVAAEKGDFEPLIELVHNPENPYDKNALQVHLGYGDKKFFVGHIPKTHNTQMLDAGLLNLDLSFDRFYFDDSGHPFGLAIFVDLKKQENT